MQFRKITIIGVGLLGGSIGLAACKRRVAKEVVGFVRNPLAIVNCSKRFAHTNFHPTTRLRDAVRDADLIILCTPISRMKILVERFLPVLKKGAIVTDVGSVKFGVVRELESLVASSGAFFVGGHPMAGSEQIGVAAARADLFENKVCVLTPTKTSNAEALHEVERFWKSLGARILRMPPRHHDLLVSRTSHLPHVIAATLANSVLEENRKFQHELLAGGFRDTTRVASGSPTMWRDITIANRKNLVVSIRKMIRDLEKVQSYLKNKDGNAQAITGFFQRAKRQRDGWLRKTEGTSPE